MKRGIKSLKTTRFVLHRLIMAHSKLWVILRSCVFIIISRLQDHMKHLQQTQPEFCFKKF